VRIVVVGQRPVAEDLHRNGVPEHPAVAVDERAKRSLVVERGLVTLMGLDRRSLSQVS
jgi:hypothetical protein